MSEEINGIEFELSADSQKGGFYGRWTCLVCGDTGTSNHLDPNEKRAIIAIKVGASIHAGMKHGQKINGEA